MSVRSRHVAPPTMALASAAEVRRALEALHAEEAERKKRIESLLDTALRTITGPDADAARLIQPRLSHVAERTADLEQRLQGTSATAAALHGEIQVLHEEKQRVNLAIEWCRAVVELKQACAALAEALERHDWDASAMHCAAALAVDKTVLHSEFARYSVPSAALPDPAPQTLAAMRARLLEALGKNFAHYTTEERDEAQATHFLSLFSKVDAHDEGLQAYTALAVSLVHAQGKSIQEKLLATAPAAPYYSALWAALFDSLAVFIHEHRPVVDRLFQTKGHPGFVQGVLPGLSGEWTRLGTQILEVWDERRKRQRLVQAVSASRFTVVDAIRTTPHTPGRIFGEEKTGKELNLPFSLTRPSTPNTRPVSPQPPGPELGAVDVLLTELALFSSQWALFGQFLRNILQTSAAAIDCAARRDAAQALGPRLDSLLTETFVPLQLWALRESIEKAHALDTADLSARPMSSSLPDDLFFMLRTIFTRTLSTSSIPVLERITAQALSLLETEFVEIVVLRMDSCRRALNVPRLVDGPRRTAAAREVKTTMIVYLNMLDVSAAYADRMLTDLRDEAFLTQYFNDMPSQEDPDVSATSDLALAQDVVSRFGSLAPKLRSALQFEMEELYTTLVMPRVQTLLTEITQELSYELDEAAYAKAEDADRIAKQLQAHWDTVLPGYREQLTESNYSLLFAQTLDAILEPWETAVLQMRFTELGALRFDKDVRAMLNFFAAQVPWGVRDKFARLQQIAFVLNKDDDDDVYEAGAALGISWQLTPSEVQQVRALCAR